MLFQKEFETVEKAKKQVIHDMGLVNPLDKEKLQDGYTILDIVVGSHKGSNPISPQQSGVKYKEVLDNSDRDIFRIKYKNEMLLGSE